MNLADYLAQFLTINGVQRIFGVPGGENVLFMEAIRKAGIGFVLFHHEAAAGFAAGVTGQLTGRPGACLSTVGPGAVNLVAAAATATLERSPMLAITAEIDSSLLPRVKHRKLTSFAYSTVWSKAASHYTLIQPPAIWKNPGFSPFHLLWAPST